MKPSLRQGCGTEAACRRHYRNGELPDEACLQAVRDATNRRRARMRANGRPAGRQPAGCGTYSAYAAHVRYGETVDDACREAARVARYGAAA